MNISVVNVRSNLADILNRAAYGGERVILERRGKPVAALVSIEDLELLEQFENQTDLAAVRKARKQGGKPVPLAKVKARLGMK
ncbi:MAG TPA: type II toxin-antitoxin system Phd/YefM family antitoxin [Pirellulales bacterium]|jgi:prevent-host-death family protein|nr:type II toxin-antitoxin system Phd/YefM family antitoxin [Pirellulales bacterium]